MNAIEILKKNEDIIKKKYSIKKIGVFGSFARGEEKEGSDIDVLVNFEEGAKTFDNFMELKFFLEDLFGRKVDLVLFQLNIPKLIKWAMITSTLFISPSKVAIDSTSSFSMRSIITILQGKSF